VHLKAILPTDRHYEGRLQFKGTKTLTLDVPVAGLPASDPERAGLRRGTYALKRVVQIPEKSGAQPMYGEAILYFVKDGSPRNMLALHGGTTDNAGKLFAGEKSLRVTNTMLEMLLTLFSIDETTLEVVEEDLGFLARFRRKEVGDLLPPRYCPAQMWNDASARDTLFWMWLYRQFGAPRSTACEWVPAEHVAPFFNAAA